MEGATIRRHPPRQPLSDLRDGEGKIVTRGRVGESADRHRPGALVDDPEGDDGGRHDVGGGAGDGAEHLLDGERRRDEPVEALERTQARRGLDQTFVVAGVLVAHGLDAPLWARCADLAFSGRRLPSDTADGQFTARGAGWR